MKIHHLNCGTLCPLAGSTLTKKFSFLKKFSMVCHCLLVETEQGLVLIDTGIGLKDVEHNDRFFTQLLFNNFGKPLLDINETAHAQIVAKGLNPLDVRHIIATHCDSDHIGGTADFPNATVHLMFSEWDEFFNQKGLKNLTRYLPEQFNHNPTFEKYKATGEKWNGFDAVKPLKGISDDILLIPLPGHTRGHAGIAIQGLERELFFVGDAYINRSQLLGKKVSPHIPLYNKLLQNDLKTFDLNLTRLSQLQEQHKNIDIFCSHDRNEFECMCYGRKL